MVKRSLARRFSLPVLGVALFACVPVVAVAHDRTTSYSTWDIRGRDAQVTVRLSELDVTRLPWAEGADLDRLLGAYLTSHVQLLAGDAPCPLSDGPRRLQAVPGRVIFE